MSKTTGSVDLLSKKAAIMKGHILLSSLLLIFELSSFLSCYRLPKSIIPQSYKIEIVTRLDEPKDGFQFEGRIIITVVCVERTSNVTLHAKDLDIRDAIIRNVDGGEEIPISKQIKVIEDDFYIMYLATQLTENNYYQVAMKFRGLLTNSLNGYYRSSYVENGPYARTRWLAVTKFEPTGARLAFPCFDEPEFKAKFSIRLGHRSELTSVSNMPRIHEERLDNDWIWTTFQESPPMSTYIVAFMVSDLKYVMYPKAKNNIVDLRTWSNSENLNRTIYASKITPDIMRIYEKKFDIKYPLPKLDLVALPDFGAVALENWGFVTFSESELLYDHDVSTTFNQVTILELVSHELAHQWFGNLVTMKWWTDLWLKEGFATFMAALVVDQFHPDWNYLQQKVALSVSTVFREDSLKSSHPVSVTFKHPSEIFQIFDSISYEKAFLLIRMMSMFLGDDAFFKGINRYLKQHSYGNADQDDLWTSITQEADKISALSYKITIKDIMDSWTLQTGYPIVTVVRNYNNHSAQIVQSRFQMSAIETHNQRDSPCWWIPIMYTDQNDLNFRKNYTKRLVWSKCPKNIENISVAVDSGKWIIFNIQAAGIYKVNYDLKNWKMLISTLNSANNNQIHELNRALLIEDSFDFAFIGQLSYEIPLEIIDYLIYETKYIPWQIALLKLDTLSDLLQRSSYFGTFQKFMMRFLTPIYQKSGDLKSDRNYASADQLSHHILLVKSACTYGVSECIAEAKEVFREWVNTSINSIPQSLRPMIYCTAIRHGNDDDWFFLWKQFKNTKMSAERRLLLASLSCSNDIHLIYKLLGLTLLDETELKMQEIGDIYNHVANSDVGFYIIKLFFHSNIMDIHKRVGDNIFIYSGYFFNLAKHINSEFEKEKFFNFVKKHKKIFSSVNMSIEQAIETITNNIHWQNNYRSDFIEHVQSNPLKE